MRSHGAAAILVLLLVATGQGAVRAQPEPALGGRPEPGARGAVRTALDSDRISEIPVTYVGLLDDFSGPGLDLHLVQLEGPEADHVGVAFGMSGSPVFIDGRLIGALSYRLGVLPKDAIAGVTPIEDMLSAERAGATGGTGDPAASPIRSPVIASGLAEPVREWLAPQLEALGLVLAAGGGVASDAEEPKPFEPGSPIGVGLVRGDMSFASTGTVTWVDGDRVFAFGHPFLGSGEVEMPMHNATVIHTLADAIGSRRLTRLGPEVGAIVEDRRSAIVGRTGHRARMIPVELSVKGGDYDPRSFSFEVVKNSHLTPLLTASAVANALVGNLGYDRQATMLATGRITLEGLPDLPIELAFAGQDRSDPGLGLAVALRQLMHGLWVNPIGEVDVTAIELQVDVDPELRLYHLESLLYDRGPVRPGQTFTVTCVLRRYRGETVRHKLSVVVPEHLTQDAPLLLAVGPPEQIDRALGRPLSRRLQSATDLREVVEALSVSRSPHRLNAVLFQRAKGVVTRGAAYTELPPSAQHLLSTRERTTATTRTSASPLDQTGVLLEGPVTGGLAIRLNLDSGLPTEESR